MTDLSYLLIVLAAPFVFVLGMAAGARGRDRIWRGKARDGTRMASGGRLFTVHQEKT